MTNTCPTCYGDGTVPIETITGYSEERCPVCKGTGLRPPNTTDLGDEGLSSNDLDSLDFEAYINMLHPPRPDELDYNEPPDDPDPRHYTLREEIYYPN